MDEAKKIFSVALPADHQAAEVVEPSEQSLHLPVPPVAAQWTTVLRELTPIGPMWRNQFNTLGAQRLLQPIAVIGRVADESGAWLDHEAALKRGVHQRHSSA